MTDLRQLSKPPNRTHGGWRRWVTWGLLLIFGWLIWSRFAEIDTFIQTLRQGRPLLIGAAIALQVVRYVLFAAIYWSAFDVMNVHTKLLQLVPLTYASTFVNSTVTAGGAAGSALFIDYTRRRGESVTRTATGTILVVAADYCAYAVILTFGLVLLLRQHDLTRLEGFSALLLYLLILGVLGMLSMGVWAPDGLRHLLHSIQHAAQRVSRFFGHPNLWENEWAAHLAEEFIAASTMLVRQPQRLLRTIAIAMSTHVVDLLTLTILFRAFHQPTTLSIVIIIYAMTVLFRIISPTPNGIGVVETLLPAIYVSVNVPLEVGTVINLTFRGISFWIPLLIGMICFHFIQTSAGTPLAQPADDSPEPLI